MNIKNYISIALLATLSAAFVACDGKEDPEYIPASAPTAAQRVFFAKSAISQIVTDDATSFNVPVYRPENADASALTVALSTEDPSGLFTVPSSVTFGENQDVAIIPVGYNTASMTPNQNYSIVISIDEANADLYGVSTVTVTMNFEQMTEWALMGYDPEKDRNGYGVWTLGSPFSGNFVNIRVFERHIPSDVKNIQYALQINIPAGLMGDFPEDDIDTSNTDYNDPNWINAIEMSTTDGGKTINIPVQDCIFYDGMIFAEASVLYPNNFKNSSYWDEVSGTFFLNLMYADDEGAWNPAVNPVTLYGYADTNEYQLSVTNSGQINIGDVDYQIIGFTFSKTVDYVDYTLVEGKLDDEQIAEVAAKIADPEQTEYTIETVEEVGNVSLSFPTSATYTIVAVGYHFNSKGEAEAKISASTTFSYETFDPYYGWTIVNPNATYTDYILADLFELPSNETYQVSFEKNDENPNLYRLSGVTDNNPYFTPEDCNGFSCIELLQVGENLWVAPYSDLGVAGYELEVCSYAYYVLASGQVEDPADIPAPYFITQSNGVFSMQALPSEDAFNFVVFNGNSAIATPNLPFSANIATTSASVPAKKHTIFHNIAAKGNASLKRPAVPAKFSAKFQKAENTRGHSINPQAARR